jgi:hypothetical protein
MSISGVLWTNSDEKCMYFSQLADKSDEMFLYLQEKQSNPHPPVVQVMDVKVDRYV